MASIIAIGQHISLTSNRADELIDQSILIIEMAP